MRIIRYPALADKGVPYCRQQLRRLIAAGQFPQPIPLNDREERPYIGWLESEIDAWIVARAAKRETKAAA